MAPTPMRLIEIGGWQRAFGLEAAEIDVDRREDHVAVLRAGEVHEEAEDEADMRPIEHVFAASRALASDAECRHERGDLSAQRPPRRRRIMACGNGERGLQQHGKHDTGDEKVDERGVERVRAAEARRPDDITLPDGEAETDQNDDGEYILQPGNPRIAADRRQAKAGKKA